MGAFKELLLYRILRRRSLDVLSWGNLVYALCLLAMFCVFSKTKRVNC